MEILVTYDVVTETEDGKRRLRRIVQVCKNYGQRVQKSVFECNVNEMQYEKMIEHLRECIEEKEDNLRIYRLREPKNRFVKSYGVDKVIEFEAPLIV